MKLILPAAAIVLLIAAHPHHGTETVDVPYRLTSSQHVMVRAKLDGKGPFNLIFDTGAPAVFLAQTAADKVGVKADHRGWAAFDTFELEGGLVVPKARARVEDLFQLKGMNGLGLAGVEIHGVIGYNVLARYRIEYDLTRPTLRMTPLDFEPPGVAALGGKGGGAGGLEAIGGFMGMLGKAAGVKPGAMKPPRGFLGVEFGDGAVVVAVLLESPAAKAGLKPGGRVKRIGEFDVSTSDDVLKRLAAHAAGASVTLTVERDGKDETVTVELGRGL